MKDKPALGDFGTLIVETILPGFCEKRIFRRPRLTWGRYLGAYQVVAGEAVLLGLRSVSAVSSPLSSKSMTLLW